MVELDETVKLNLLRDYTDVQNHIERILRGTDNNYIVKSPDYFHPSVWMNQCVPLSNPSGLFNYYRGMRELLETALMDDQIDMSRLPGGLIDTVPRYVSDIVNPPQKRFR